jgi:large subunit ribosomal protein L17
MRHGKTINHLGRMAPHRDALLQNLAVSLIMHKRINTTVAKAKALKRFVEPIITRSKDDSMHNRRTAFAYLQDKHAVKELFASVGDKVASRPGGYTRIIRTGFRLGDAAEMCMIELVDFNELMLAETQTRKTKTRRSRAGKRSSGTGASVDATVDQVTLAAAALATNVVDTHAVDVTDIEADAQADSIATEVTPVTEPVESGDSAVDVEAGAVSEEAASAASDHTDPMATDSAADASTVSPSDADVVAAADSPTEPAADATPDSSTDTNAGGTADSGSAAADASSDSSAD